MIKVVTVARQDSFGRLHPQLRQGHLLSKSWHCNNEGDNDNAVDSDVDFNDGGADDEKVVKVIARTKS